MRKILLLKYLPLLILFCNVAHSQHDHFACSYYGETIEGNVKMSAAAADAKEIIRQIVSVVGLKSNFEIRAANVPNAAAVVLQGKRYILYNRNFMSAINSASGTDWAGISILAHEIGHHLNGHTIDNQGSRPDLELEADEFSGFVLSKMGATLEDAQVAMSIAASQKGSHTHPAKKDRLIAIAGGWNNATNQMGGRATASVKKSDRNITKPAEVKTEPAPESVIAEKYIAFDVHFNADQQGQYYITTRGNLVSIDNGSLYVIGRLAESNKRGYKLMLSDKNYNYLYIGSRGDIVNGSGRKVGQIATHN